MDKSAVTTKYIANKVIRGLANRSGTLSKEKLERLVSKLIDWSTFKNDQINRVIGSGDGFASVIKDISAPVIKLLPKKIRAALPRTSIPGLPDTDSIVHRLPWRLNRSVSLAGSMHARRALDDVSDAIRHLSSKPNNPNLVFPLSLEANRRIIKETIGQMRKEQLADIKKSPSRSKLSPIRPQAFRSRLPRRLGRATLGQLISLPVQTALALRPGFAAPFHAVNPGRNVFTWIHELGHALDHAKRGLNTKRELFKHHPEVYLDEAMANRRGSQLLRYMQQTQPNSFYNSLSVKDYLNAARTSQQEGYKTSILANQLAAGKTHRFGIDARGASQNVRVPGYMRNLYNALNQARSSINAGSISNLDKPIFDFAILD